MRTSFFLLIFVFYLYPECAFAQLRIEELSLIKIVIPEKFKTDYDWILKLAELYDRTKNSETAKALDDALGNFLKKVDVTTATIIREWRRREPETLGALIEKRDSKVFWNATLKKNTESFYCYISHKKDSGKAFFKYCQNPVELCCGEKSIQLLELDRKILLEKIKYWNAQPENFKELYNIDKELALMPQKIENAKKIWDNLKKSGRSFTYDFEGIETAEIKKAREEYEKQVEISVGLRTRRENIYSDFSATENIDYNAMKTLLDNVIFKEIPEALLRERI